MSKPAFTPGPWFVFGNGLCVGGPFVPGPVDDPERTTAGVAMCGMRLRDIGEAEANARLIAAAPDLLAACRMVLDDPGLTAGANDVIRAAVAKAEAANT